MIGRVDERTDFFRKVDNFAKKASISSTCIFGDDDCGPAFITIAIPTYKRASLLKDALDSALSQDAECACPVIVVDNNAGRGDETEVLMDAYRDRKHVVYFKNKENLGMGGNWNRCLELARSTWVVLLHDDDCLDAGFLRKVLPYLKNMKMGILQTRKYTDPDKRPVRRFNNLKKVGRLDMLYAHSLDVPSGIVYHRDSVLAAGGFNDDFYPSLDYCFHTVFLGRNPVYILNEDLTYYRVAVNASQSPEVQEAWLVNGYYLNRQVLRRYGFPSWIVGPFLQIRTERARDTIEGVWHGGLGIPECLPAAHFSPFRRAVSYLTVNAAVLYEKLKARTCCLWNVLKMKLK